VGICILIAPEIVVGAVIITGAVVVGFAIKEALDAYDFVVGVSSAAHKEALLREDFTLKIVVTECKR
jgi:hypothetical protein